MKQVAVSFCLLYLACVSQAQYEFILDPALLPAGHGQPGMTVCVQYQQGFTECTDLDFYLNPETGLYHGVAALACIPAWLSSFTARMECHCIEQDVLYTFPPFQLPMICSPGYSPGTTGLEAYFQFDTECTCPIRDLAIRREANQLRLDWSPANGQPGYYIRGYAQPYDATATGQLLATTQDTCLVLTLGPDLPAFFRVSAFYPEPALRNP